MLYRLCRPKRKEGANFILSHLLSSSGPEQKQNAAPQKTAIGSLVIGWRFPIELSFRLARAVGRLLSGQVRRRSFKEFWKELSAITATFFQLMKPGDICRVARHVISGEKRKVRRSKVCLIRWKDASAGRKIDETAPPLHITMWDQRHDIRPGFSRPVYWLRKQRELIAMRDDQEERAMQPMGDHRH